MTKWLLAGAVVGVTAFLAGPVSAQEQIAPPQGPAVSSGDTMMVTPARRGLLGRRRAMTTTYYGTYSTTPMMAGQTTPPSGVQQAQALEQSGGVQQAQGLERAPMTTTTTQATTQSTMVERRGLFPRLRARRAGY